MLRILFDDILEPTPASVSDPSVFWTVLGIVAGVAAITAVIIVILVRKKHKGGN